MGLRVQSAGSQSLLVDLGRPRSRSLGVPIGGAADHQSFFLGNALLGNEPNTLALEIAWAGPTLEATAHHALVVFGAPFGVWLNERLHPAGKTLAVAPGDVLTIGTTPKGMRAYLCARGGFQAKEIMASRSALEPVRAGQELRCSESSLRARSFLQDEDSAENRLSLRVLPGTHADQFPAEALVGLEFRVAMESNRMGLRLRGPRLERDGEELLSSPVCPGTVQVTHDGQLIVLGVDAQTLGGYPRLAQVIAADLDKLAQLRPEDGVRFQGVDLPTAVQLAHERQARLRDLWTRLRNSLF